VAVLDDGEDGLLTAALRALRGDDSGPGRQEYEQDLRDRALHVLPASSACRRIVYTTKVDWLLSVLGWGEAAPEDVAVLWRWAPVGKAHVAVIRAVVEALGAPLVFVGDLDPLDLATFSTLTRALDGLPVRYAGVGDGWVALCERHLAPGRALRSLCIAMSEPERAALRHAEEIGLGWDALAGPRGMALLDSGVKLELEGASNPAFFSAALAGELAHLVLD
jgi:hypothetical protein